MSFDLVFVAQPYLGSDYRAAKATTSEVTEQRRDIIDAILNISPTHIFNPSVSGLAFTGWLGSPEGSEWPDFDVYPAYFFTSFAGGDWMNDPTTRSEFESLVSSIKSVFSAHNFEIVDLQAAQASPVQAVKPWWQFW